MTTSNSECAVYAHGNSIGAPMLFVAPRIVTIRRIFGGSGGVQGVDVEFAVLAPGGEVRAHIWLTASLPDVQVLAYDAMHGTPMLIRAVEMQERHPETGRPWLCGSMRELGGEAE